MKVPFDLFTVLKEIEEAVAPYPKAAMFDLYERGYTSVFEQLIACVISIRTRDETSLPLSQKLFAIARTPGELMQLSPQELEKILAGSTFPGQKAYTILGIAKTVIEKYKGILPPRFEDLIQLKGVGPKCANLAIGVATGTAAMSVDVHVHRVTNRWGYVQTKQPEQTMEALQQKAPSQTWVDLNRLLVPFGKHICTGQLPCCSTCPVLRYCKQTGVTTHR